MIVVLWSVSTLSSLCTYHGRGPPKTIDALVQSVCWFRNTATDAVKQELLFVGQESGKPLAMRNLVRKVRLCNGIDIRVYIVDVG